MKNMKTLLAALFTALVLTATAWASPQVVTLNVPGMTCPVCPITVKKALEKVQGVSKVDVRFEKKQVLVTFDDAKTNTGCTRESYNECRLSLAAGENRQIEKLRCTCKGLGRTRRSVCLTVVLEMRRLTPRQR